MKQDKMSLIVRNLMTFSQFDALSNLEFKYNVLIHSIVVCFCVKL